jgi:uncharacterized protein YjdB
MMSARTSVRFRTLAGCLVIGALVACGDDDGTGPGAVARLEINNLAATDTLGVGSTVTLHPVILDANDRVVTGAEYTWSSSNDAVATVNEIGQVEIGDAAGSAVIRLESGGVRDSVMLTVVRAELRGGAATIVEGATTQFTAGLVGPGGDVAGAELEFSSSDEEVLEVDEDGTVTAVAPGTAEVTVSWAGPHGDVTDSAEITVTEDAGTIPPLRVTQRIR